MAIQAVILWGVSLAIILVNPRSRAFRWFALGIFFSSFGAITVFLEDQVHASLFLRFSASSDAGVMILFLTGVICSISLYFAPYACVMFSIFYTEKMFVKSRRLQRVLGGLLLLPPVAMYCLYPIDGTRNPSLNPDFRWLAGWVTLYLVTGLVMVLLSWFREKDVKMRRDRKLTSLIIIPVNLYLLVVHYILRALDIQDVWRDSALVVIPVFFALLYLSARYGIWGVRLKVEKDNLERVINSATSGTALINHAIKNEIYKIRGCAEVLKSSLPPGAADSGKKLEIIEEASRHIFSMTERIQNHVKDIHLQLAWENLNGIIGKALELTAPLLREKEIELARELDSRVFLECDRVYTTEMFFNLFQNAVESMQPRGRLVLGGSHGPQGYTVKVRDNGKGIPEDLLPYVFDPFFTTRGSGHNFGLGLTFCYKVMNKLGGRFELQSEVDRGTLALLHFPRGRVRKLAAPERPVESGPAAIRVLVVEDDPFWHALTVDLFKRERDIVVLGWVRTREEAVAAAAELEPDVILMDIELPGGMREGIYATAEITRQGRSRVVMLTVQDDEEIIRDAFTAGAVDYVHKSRCRQLPGAVRRAVMELSPFNILLDEYTRLKSAELLSPLTATEKQIFAFMEQRLTRKQIAERLFISDNTMRKHVGSILKKLGASRTKEAVRKVQYRGIVKSSR